MGGGEMAGHNARFIGFPGRTGISGIDLEGTSIRKGGVDAVLAHVEGGTTAPVRLSARGGGGTATLAAPTATVSRAPRELTQIGDRIANQGGTPPAGAQGDPPLGGLHLKGLSKRRIRGRLCVFR